jgi:hypothetical protein
MTTSRATSAWLRCKKRASRRSFCCCSTCARRSITRTTPSTVAPTETTASATDTTPAPRCLLVPSLLPCVLSRGELSVEFSLRLDESVELFELSFDELEESVDDFEESLDPFEPSAAKAPRGAPRIGLPISSPTTKPRARAPTPITSVLPSRHRRATLIS